MILYMPFTAAILFLVTPALLLVMLLPTLLEVRKPQDSGPRLITLDLSEAVPVLAMKVSALYDIDEHHEVDFSLTPFLKVILDILPNIDA